MMKFHSRKYHNKITYVDGIKFHSMLEADYYGVCKYKLFLGLIWDLELQPSFDLKVNNQKICKYKADFKFKEKNNPNIVVVDTKGFETKDFVLKKKLMQALYPEYDFRILNRDDINKEVRFIKTCR